MKKLLKETIKKLEENNRAVAEYYKNEGNVEKYNKYSAIACELGMILMMDEDPQFLKEIAAIYK